jgi:uncharacterized ferredoxin-like protein
MKNKTGLRRFFLDEEVARIAKGQKTVSAEPPADILKRAARALRDHRIAMDSALKAAGVPKGTPVEFSIQVAGQAAKIAEEVQFLEKMFRLEDQR